MIDMNSMINMFRGFVQNPAQYLAQRMLPQNALQDPRNAVQQLMNSGQMTQQQFNQLQQAAQTIQRNPMFARMFGG